MRLRHLRIRIQTSNGLYGSDIPFPDGMIVIWADNSMGKSTCVKSILVALGLESILTTSQTDLPLTPVMKSLLEDERGNTHQVTESRIFLEIENSDEKRVTIERLIRGDRDHNLVTVVDGPALTAPSKSYNIHEYFLGRSGAASREKGFHYFLASFLKWNLPTVQTFEGRDCLLYLQCVFPFLIVEQSRGWTAVQPPIPGQFRIRDVYKRTVEFLLNMDAHKIALQRAELQLERERLEGEWSAALRQIGDAASSISGRAQGIPTRPVAIWPVELEPTIVVPYEGEWGSVEDRLESLEVEHQRLVEEEIPRVQEIAIAAAGELNVTEQGLKDKEALYSRLLQSFELERGELASIHHRITALEEDIQKNRDLRVLRDMGSNRL